MSRIANVMDSICLATGTIADPKNFRPQKSICATFNLPSPSGIKPMIINVMFHIFLRRKCTDRGKIPGSEKGHGKSALLDCSSLQQYWKFDLYFMNFRK